MLSRVRVTAKGLLVISGLLVGGMVAGCGTPVAAPPGSSPASSATGSTSPPTASASPAPTTSATPASTASASSSPGTGSTNTAESSPSNPDEETGTYGTDLTVAGTKLEFTRLRWYWGKDAKARCKKQKILPADAWCNDYYFEDEGDRVSTSLADQVQIKVLNEDAELKPATRAQLEKAISDSIWPHFVIQLADGEAVAITQIYTQ
jgi:hypothetical protein